MLELVVFICGAVVMILEMVGSRVLAPYLGTSIVVWTSLIGIILGSLSLGYWWGGRIADRSPTRRKLSLVILLAAFCIGAVAVSKSFILGVLQLHGGSVHAVSSAATFLLFAPPSVLLGMVSPLAVRLKIADLGSSGRTVGRLYAISTLGSILGTFGAGFYLIAFFGSTNILLVLALVLAATSLLAEIGYFRAKVAAMGVFVLLLIGATAYDAHLAGVGLHDMDTEYSRILVYDAQDWRTDRKMRVMVTNPGGFQSGMYLEGENSQTELALAYTRYYRLAPHFRPDVKRMLMLGGGGYSFPKYVMANWPDVTMDVVEIDPQVTAIAKRYFALEDNPRLRIFHEDARIFLNRYHWQAGVEAQEAIGTGRDDRSRGQYDVILTDTFNSHHSIPFHLSTVEAVSHLYGLLDDNGVVLANILSAIDGDLGRFLRAEYATFKAVFPQVYLFPVSDPEDPTEWQNIMLVALKSDKVPAFTSPDKEINEFLSHLWTQPVKEDLPVLTDDYAPVDRYITLVE